jgi:GH15 family glucan-1,4-alpha-glucosidase
MYGVGGERRLTEYTLPWLPGYEGAAPVRIGNLAAGQVQLDVYGEVLDAFFVARRAGLVAEEASWALECALIGHLEKIWDQPDDGIWEVRGERRHFTHSKVMAWVAFDRAVRSVEEFNLEGPVDHWRAIRETIHKQICERGFDSAQNSFVQSYGARALDASLLLIPVVGFLEPSPIRAFAARLPRLSVTWSEMGSCFAIAPRRERTDCHPEKARFSPAASGSSITMCCRNDTPRRALCLDV